MTDRKPLPKKKNIREALIDAGIELVREGGSKALTIRGVAARVGVSHAAPKHHFATLEALRTAVAIEGHHRFTAAMEAAIAEAPPGPREALVATGIGYIRFSREHPGLFQVMFSDPVDREDPAFQEAAHTSYQVLARVSAPVIHGPAGAEGTETLVWSLAHGFSALILGGKPELQDPAHAEEVFRQIFPVLPMRPPQGHR